MSKKGVLPTHFKYLNKKPHLKPVKYVITYESCRHQTNKKCIVPFYKKISRRNEEGS